MSKRAAPQPKRGSWQPANLDNEPQSGRPTPTSRSQQQQPPVQYAYPKRKGPREAADTDQGATKPPPAFDLPLHRIHQLQREAPTGAAAVAVPATRSPKNDADDGEKPRSSSPKEKFTVLPCVAHPNYTRHQNCGCMKNRHHSPEARKSKEPSPQVWEDPPAKIDTAPPPPPPVPEWEALHRVGSVPVHKLKHMATSKALSQPTVATSEAAGKIVKRESMSGEAVGAPIQNGGAQVTAMRSVDDRVWCGFHDGWLRVYDQDEVAFEAHKHASSITALAHCADGFVYSASMDWKIFKWPMVTAATTKLRPSAFGSHTLGVRCLAEAQCRDGMTFLISGGDDNEIRCWLIVSASANLLLDDAVSVASGPSEVGAKGAQTSNFFSLMGHDKSVLCAAFCGERLWSGSEDTKVKVWNIRDRQCLHTLDDHRAGVLSIEEVGPNIWTLDKLGVAIMYNSTQYLKVHRVTFGPEEGPMKSPRFPAQMFYVMPVEGHLLWISDVNGSTTSWFAPSCIDHSTTETTKRTRNVAEMTDFEQSERMVELYFKLESQQHRLIDELGANTDSHFNDLRSFFDSCFHDGNDEASRLNQLVAQLRSQLEDAENTIDAMRNDMTEKEAFDELQRIAQQHRDDADQLRERLTTALSRIADLEAENDALTKALHKAEQDNAGFVGDLDDYCKTLKQQIEDMEKQIDSLKSENSSLKSTLEKGTEEGDALRALLAENEALKKELATRPTEVQSEKIVKVVDDSANDKIDELQTEVQRLRDLVDQLRAEGDAKDKQIAAANSTIDQLLMEKNEAVAKLSLADVDSLKDLTDARAEAARFRNECDALKEYSAEVDAELERARKSIAELQAQLDKINQNKNDRDAVELKVRLEYEARIKELVERVQSLEALVAKRAGLDSENEHLKGKLTEFTSPRYQDLLNENIDLKRQMKNHQEHIARLLASETSLRELVDQLKRHREHHDAAIRQKRTGGTNVGWEVHDPSQPHHKESCIWCSGAINISAGSTLKIFKPRNSASPSRSASTERSKSPMCRSRSAQHTERSVSAPTRGPSELLKDEATRLPPALPSSDKKRTSTGFAGKPLKRVEQLEQAKNAATSEEVRTALVDEIMAIHKKMKEDSRGQQQ